MEKMNKIDNIDHYNDYFIDSNYWDHFYAQEKKNRRNKKDWYLESKEFVDIIDQDMTRTLRPNKTTKTKKNEIKILHIGCGSSTVAQSLFPKGYEYILNIDFSQVVIKQMEKMVLSQPLPNTIEWLYQDVTDMLAISSNVFNIVIDKGGCMDCILLAYTSKKNDHAFTKMMEEIQRVLKKDGIMYVLSKYEEKDWKQRIDHMWEKDENFFEVFRCSMVLNDVKNINGFYRLYRLIISKE